MNQRNQVWLVISELWLVSFSRSVRFVVDLIVNNFISTLLAPVDLCVLTVSLQNHREP